ncbi:ABC transporter ATP-binding protein [Sutcliffiella rhizosphaerae]|nr:ABC transporter ATP-binding protein [Sutcliffiella rhizosphaerae]
MMVIAAVLETIGIGMIVPLVGIVTNPSVIKEHYLLIYIYELFNFSSTSAFMVFSVLALLSIFILKNMYLLLFNYIQYKVILNQQVKLQGQLFKKYLTRPYIFHLNRNTSTLLRNVNEEVARVCQGIVLSAFQLLSEILIILFIFILLIVTSPIATITASFLLGGSVFIFFRVFRNKISSLGKELQSVNGTLIKWVNQGLGANKEIKVLGKENFFINSYTNQSLIKIRNSRYIKILEVVPRLFIETLLVSVVLITMLIIIFQGTNTTQLVSTMALFAMAAFRIMPSINRVVALITNIKYSKPALDVVYEDLFLNKDSITESGSNGTLSSFKLSQRTFNQSIELENVFFKYPNQKNYSIKNVSLTIPTGKSVAIIGESGSGKTTIVDIMLGLLLPEKGKVIVDGVDLHNQISLWQKKIGYIPQTIFLSDDSIRNNIAFGVDTININDDQVWKALEQAQLKDFVLSLPEKLDTSVGERGVRLSGGQRQRIGIARALYHNPEILFMDEATSALDNETEMEVMKAIDNLKGQKTLIIIAHRLSTISNCDIVFKLKQAQIVEVEYQNNSSIPRLLGNMGVN